MLDKLLKGAEKVAAKAEKAMDKVDRALLRADEALFGPLPKMPKGYDPLDPRWDPNWIPPPPAPRPTPPRPAPKPVILGREGSEIAAFFEVRDITILLQERDVQCDRNRFSFIDHLDRNTTLTPGVQTRAIFQVTKDGRYIFHHPHATAGEVTREAVYAHHTIANHSIRTLEDKVDLLDTAALQPSSKELQQYFKSLWAYFNTRVVQMMATEALASGYETYRKAEAGEMPDTTLRFSIEYGRESEKLKETRLSAALLERDAQAMKEALAEQINVLLDPSAIEENYQGDLDYLLQDKLDAAYQTAQRMGRFLFMDTSNGPEIDISLQDVGEDNFIVRVNVKYPTLPLERVKRRLRAAFHEDAQQMGERLVLKAAEIEQIFVSRAFNEGHVDVLADAHKYMKEKDHIGLGKLLEEEKGLFSSTSDAGLIRTYVLASLFLKRNEAALQEYSKLTDRTPREEAVVGYLKLELGDREGALEHLGKVKGRSLDVRLTRCSIKYEEMEGNMQEYEIDLASHLDTSYQANWFLGAVAFNAGDYPTAERYLSRALELDGKNEKVYLDLLRLKAASEQLQNEDISRFYLETGSTMEPEKLQEELEGIWIDIPVHRYEGCLYGLAKG